MPVLALHCREAQTAASAGFTLVELVIVIVIMGILAAVAAPRFFDRAVFDERGFYDDTLAALRYAQKLAVASGCAVQVNISAAAYTLNQHATNCTSGAFTLPVYNPGNGTASYANTAPSGLAITPMTLTFNALGQAGGDASITLTGSSGTRSITVIGETGFVY